MSLLSPFPDQREALDALATDYESGLQRCAVVMPTGTGKTVTFAIQTDEFLTVNPGSRVGIIVHRDELVNQTVNQIHGVNPDRSIGVVKAARNEIDHEIVIMSVQTIANQNRLEQIPPDWFGLIIVDECHHAAADSYMNAIRYFGGFDHSGRDDSTRLCTLITGYTATMVRNDSRGLGNVWQKISYERDILWAIRNGRIVDIRGMAIQVESLLDDVNMSRGDYAEGALGESMVKHHAGSAIARGFQEHAVNRSAISFAPTVAAAYQIADELNGAGVTTEVVHGAMPRDERLAIYARSRSGETQVISNCGVLTEGFDEPHISCVIMARPTTNRGLFTQCVGRGARLWKLHNPSSPYPWIREPKRDCLVLILGDGKSAKLAGLSVLSTGLAGPVRDNETLTEAEEREEETGPDTPSRPTRISVSITDVDLFERQSRYTFKRTVGKEYLYIPTGDWLVTIYPETTAPDTLFMVGQVWAGRGRRQLGTTVVRNVDLGTAMAVAETRAAELDPVGTASRKDASWRKKKKELASPAQKSFAKGLRIPFGDDVTKVELSDMIDSVVASRNLNGWNPPDPVAETE